MTSAAEVLDGINELERVFPVHQWRADDIDLWPIYRVRLFMDVTMAALGGAGGPGTAGRLGQLAERAARALWRVPLAAWRDRRMNATVQPGLAAVFLSDGLSFTRIGERWCDRIVDPLQLALQQQGLHSIKLTPLAEAHVPRLVPSQFIQPAIDRIKVAARRRELHGLPEFDRFLAAARARFGAYAGSRDWLALQAGRLDALARWFERALERSGAQHALVNNYYSLEGMAFVQAARRAGVRSIDLQHGLQGEHHGAYGRWSNVPSDTGFSTLPEEFWVWTEEEAAAINAWCARGKHHRPRVTGNLWRERWLDDSDPLVARYVQQARALRRGRAAQVLVSLAWGLADEETEKLLCASRLCGERVGWWWRLHPVEAHRQTEFARRLQRHGLDASQVGPATDLPLYALLRTADLTVAHSSTVIQEAAVFGVPSVVTSDYGAELHAGLVKAGVVLHATSPEDIARAVDQLAARERAGPAGSTHAKGLANLIEITFGASRSAAAARP